MAPIGYHLVFRLADDRVLLTTRGARRLAARALLAQDDRFRLCAFGPADNHLHTVVMCSDEDAGRFARCVGNSLHRRLRLRAPFQATRRKAIAHQGHFYAAVRYVLRQEEHHGIDPDPLRDACCLPDMLGMRAVDSRLAQRVRTYLPRLRRGELLELLGCPELDAAPLAIDEIADAAAAALALPQLDGRAAEVVIARRAAVHAIGNRLATGEIAAALGVDARTVLRLRSQPPAPQVVRAVELQLRLRHCRKRR